MATAAVDSSGKRKEIESILEKLDNSKDQSSQQTAALLERLKVLGRQPQDSDAIYSKNGVSILARYATKTQGTTSREALSCLANATILRPSVRQTIVDLGQAAAIADFYHSTFVELDNEFLCARLLLMLTDQTDLDFGKLIEHNQLAETINSAIAAHAHGQARNGTSKIAKPDMAISETLKLLYSLLSNYPQHEASFAPCTSSLLQILAAGSVPTQASSQDTQTMEPPMSHVVNALFKFDTKHLSRDALFPDRNPKAVTDVLVDMTTNTIAANRLKMAQLDMLLSPLLGLISEVYRVSQPEVRHSVKAAMLPADSERNKPLGQSDTLAGRLLQLSTSATNPELRQIVPTVLFNLSDQDPHTFVRNVGLGYAIGFLQNNGIQVPGYEQTATSTEGGRLINPVTGQYLADEPRSSMPPMTDDEKEREAERLFVLFERLRATGVMDVANPVEEAVRSGRFSELE